MQNSIECLYASNEYLEPQNVLIIAFTVSPKNEILRYTQDLYAENYKTLMNKIKDLKNRHNMFMD